MAARRAGIARGPQGNLWFGVSFQAAVAKFDPKTEKFQMFPLTGEFNQAMTQINMASPQSSQWTARCGSRTTASP